MRRLIIAAACTMALPISAFAHVTVNPRASKPGAEEKYTVRVPTEKPVPTTSVELEIPAGMMVSQVSAPEGATHEEKRDNSRVVVIVWTKEIKPRESAELGFVAKNPASGDITWKVHQRYADGTASDWAPVTKLTDAASADAAPMSTQHAAPSSDGGSIEGWLDAYDTAFNAKDLDKLATFYHADVTIYEGGGINNGWTDYRDRHLGPELREFQNLQFGHTDRKVQMVGDRGAYVISNYTLKAKMGDRDIDSGGLETLVLLKGDDGAWKIRHSHTSSRPVRRPAGQ